MDGRIRGQEKIRSVGPIKLVVFRSRVTAPSVMLSGTMSRPGGSGENYKESKTIKGFW